MQQHRLARARNSLRRCSSVALHGPALCHPTPGCAQSGAGKSARIPSPCTSTRRSCPGGPAHLWGGAQGRKLWAQDLCGLPAGQDGTSGPIFISQKYRVSITTAAESSSGGANRPTSSCGRQGCETWQRPANLAAVCEARQNTCRRLQEFFISLLGDAPLPEHLQSCHKSRGGGRLSASAACRRRALPDEDAPGCAPNTPTTTPQPTPTAHGVVLLIAAKCAAQVNGCVEPWYDGGTVGQRQIAGGGPRGARHMVQCSEWAENDWLWLSYSQQSATAHSNRLNVCTNWPRIVGSRCCLEKTGACVIRLPSRPQKPLVLQSVRGQGPGSSPSRR